MLQSHKFRCRHSDRQKNTGHQKTKIGQYTYCHTIKILFSLVIERIDKEASGPAIATASFKPCILANTLQGLQGAATLRCSELEALYNNNTK